MEKCEEMATVKSHIALGKRLRRCSSFRCLGVRPNWQDYPEREKEAIRNTKKIYYPGPLYEDLFIALEKDVFPRNSCGFIGNKIRQTSLFQMLEIPHPRTRFYYGKNRHERVCDQFRYPFIAKSPVGSSKGRGVWLIRDQMELEKYLVSHNPGYIQEYLPIDRDLRVVIVNARVINAYWRIGCRDEFRNNVSQGAEISYDNIPDDGIRFALNVAQLCRFDEVGLDICALGNQYYVLEANMVYGLEGFHRAELDVYSLLSEMDMEGLL